MMRWRRASLIPVLSSGVTRKGWPAVWLLMGWGEREELLCCDQGAACTKVSCLCAQGVGKAGRSWCVIAVSVVNNCSKGWCIAPAVEKSKC